MNILKDKKNIIIGLCVLIIIVLIGFIGYLSKSQLAEKNNNKDSSIKITSDQVSTDEVTVNKNENVVKEDIKQLNINDVATKENKYELTVLGSNFAKTINPPNTSGFYSYYEAKEDGHQYLEVKYNYKNLSENNIGADDVVTMTIKYNNKYEYTGFSVIEDSDSDFTYTNITNIAPLTTGKLHYLFDIPDEVADSDSSIVATIKCGGDTYMVNLR